MHSVVGRTLVLTLMMASPALAQIPSNCDPNSDKQRPFDPAHYVKIFEETSGRRIVLYDPRAVLTSPTLLRADADSKIVLEIDPDCLGSDMALNALFVSAELSRSDASAGPVKVEVLNYSEVAADPRTQASQAGVALQTAGDVRVVLQGLYNLTKDLVGSIYADECLGRPQSEHLRPAGCDYQFKSGLTTQSAENILRTRLRAFQPRVNAMTDFFSGDKNALVLNEIGTVVFSLDLRSLKATAAMLKSDVAAFLNDTDSPQRARAGEDIRLYLQRIWDDMQPLRAELLKNPNYFTDQWEKVLLPHFRNLLAPGTIDLAKYKAADGDALTITVQARSTSGDANGGVSRDFQIGIRKYHARVMTASSAFYLRRNGTILDDQGKPISQTFAPAPGVTFGPVFYSRGMKKGPETEKNGKSVWIAQDTTWSRFYSALAPGIGINVSLMNFSSNDFDPSIKDSAGNVVGGFRTTTSASIQVGTGISASLFSNAIQFTYGWNLSVSDKRSYWGIGFGFIEIGQEIAKVAKK